jgi:hypothetical protein
MTKLPSVRSINRNEVPSSSEEKMSIFEKQDIPSINLNVKGYISKFYILLPTFKALAPVFNTFLPHFLLKNPDPARVSISSGSFFAGPAKKPGHHAGLVCQWCVVCLSDV